MAVTLKLDAQLTILEVGGDWTHFAEQNGGGHSCAPPRVVGRPLRDFISGDATRMWVETALTYARLQGAPVERPYRCDSPTEKRHMLMRIVPFGQALEVEHELLRVEPMRQPTHLLFEAVGAGRPKRRCSRCNRIEERGVWFEPDDLDDQGAPRFPGAQPVTHILCPVCECTP